MFFRIPDIIKIAKENTVSNYIFHNDNIDDIVGSEVKQMIDVAYKKAQEIIPIRRHNSGFLHRLEYATRFIFNLFAVFVLKVDHRMVDFKTYKEQKGKQEPAVYFGPNTFFQRYNRVIGEIPNTLENARHVIEFDDQKAMVFYRWLLDVAYNSKPIWQDIFKTFRTMNVKETYAQDDLKSMLKTGNLSSPDNLMENGLRNLLDNRKLNKQSGIAG